MRAAVEMKMELEIGDAVIRGKVVGIQREHGRTKLTIETPEGKEYRGLDRQEFFYTTSVTSR
jgi:ABC-type uncharacterized transport system ATPase subunit